MSHAQSKARGILRALADGPATSEEVAYSVSLDRYFVSATLSNLYRRHCVTRCVFHRRARGKKPFLYQISGLGLREIGATP